jgi:hypothetical protein
MCIAMFKPAGVDVPIERLSQGWISNPDGGGYGYVKDGKTVISNGHMKLRDFLAAYNKDKEENPESPFLLHFRIRSAGAKGPINTHPFQIEGGILIHNGTLTGTGASWFDGPSDTKIFADRFSKHLNHDFVLNNKQKWEEAVGFGNKLAILYDDGRHQIINEHAGVWTDGVWYSNRSYVSWSGNTNNTPAALCDLQEDWE